MTATRAILLCIVLVIVQACADESGRVVKQVAFNRNVPPAWRSSMRVRQVFKLRGPRKECRHSYRFQIQGNFPRLSAFYDGGSRPQLFNYNKRSYDIYDGAER